MKSLLEIRNPDCTKCKMHQGSDVVCEMGTGNPNASVMVVNKFQASAKRQKEMEAQFKAQGLNPDEMFFTAAVKCKAWELNPSSGDVKQCKEYLEAEIAQIKPEWIISFGNEGLLSLTGHSGITAWRSKVLTRPDGVKTFSTISPGAVDRNPGQKPGFDADLRYFEAQLNGRKTGIKIPKIRVVQTMPELKKFKKILGTASLVSYDIETNGFSEFDDQAKISTLAFTLVIDDKASVWVLPLGHIDSPFRKVWRRILPWLSPEFEKIPKQLAHNGKFDSRWLRHFGFNAIVTFDTLLACHLIDENRPKGLKPQAISRLGVEPWAIETKDLDSTPLDEVCHYNALDTYYTYLIYLQLKKQLLKRPRLAKIFQHILMPANEILIEAERRGVWLDREKLATATKIAFDTRDEIEAKLMEFVPSPESPGSSLHTESNEPWPTKGKTTKPVAVNFNASNFARWWLFDHLDLPVIERTNTGMPSMAEGCLMELRGAHPVIDLMLERVKWQKYCSSFLDSYAVMLDEQDRIHTTFKLWGTVTGRLSSGKADAEKITAKTNIRGVNLQQVPRDPFIRGLFGAAPGYSFVEIDFSQVELRVVAFLSRDPTMLRLYQSGEDIHRATAAWVLGVPPSKVSKEDRKKAKAVNFGFVYGMGAPKFVSTAFEKYEVVFTLDEARAIRKTFFQQFSGLQPWHGKQRRLVNKYARVSSPLGRIRNLPDVRSEDEGVRAEAERQAINSPVQGFASDMNLLAMIEATKRLRKAGLDAHPIGTVHDATLFEIRTKHLREALPIIKVAFDDVPVDKFGVYLDVPIIADVKVGKYWGSARELSTEEVFDYKGEPDGNDG